MKSFLDVYGYVCSLCAANSGWQTCQPRLSIEDGCIFNVTLDDEILGVMHENMTCGQCRVRDTLSSSLSLDPRPILMEESQ